MKSSAVHFRLEYIHPFRDGNGRIGRLGQTLILAQWKPSVCLDADGDAGAPQPGAVLQSLAGFACGARRLTGRPFIDFMLDAIANSLYKG
ncbi:MAG: Fic family protein [Burkholderiales bacterium]|nr:Fic family protein [Burkholderiales bacterium]